MRKALIILTAFAAIVGSGVAAQAATVGTMSAQPAVFVAGGDLVQPIAYHHRYHRHHRHHRHY